MTRSVSQSGSPSYRDVGRSSSPYQCENCHPHSATKRVTLLDPFKQTLQTGRWILANPLVLVVIAAGVLFDQPIRQLLVVSSQLYARIDIPVLYFGMSSVPEPLLLGYSLQSPMRRLATSQSPQKQFPIAFWHCHLWASGNCTAYSLVGCWVFHAALVIHAAFHVSTEPLPKPVG